MKGLIPYLLMSSTLFAISPAFAKITPWIPNLPSSLDVFQGNSQQLAELTGERILIYAHPASKTHLPTFKTASSSKSQFYSAAVVLTCIRSASRKITATLSELCRPVSDPEIRQSD